MKLFYRHFQCARTHDNYRELAACIWRRAKVQGDGRYAVVSHCARPKLVTLLRDAAGAIDAKRRVDEVGCCDDCTGDHELVKLAIPVRDPVSPAPAKPDTKVRSKDAVHARQRSRLRLKK